MLSLSSLNSSNLRCDLRWPQMKVPFLQREVLDIRANQLPLYELIFVPALGTHQTLALIGFVQQLGETFCVAELQERLAALVYKVSTLISSMTVQTLAVSKQHVLLILYCECFSIFRLNTICKIFVMTSADFCACE